MRKVYAGLLGSLDGVVGGPNEWQPSSGTLIATYRPIR